MKTLYMAFDIVTGGITIMIGLFVTLFAAITVLAIPPFLAFAAYMEFPIIGQIMEQIKCAFL